MFLYKIEITTRDLSSLVAIVIADSDEKAFSYAESQVRRQYVIVPEISEISLVEKKYLDKGKGYLIEATAL